ncbi:hypothetical protein M2152_000407 [Microbacteriaceae bacterium SG_E_30_P1]|uniref:Glycosyltransferase 2-like domain-containing protein n=1 Tax=Antiquaquibacter oligotrophicus TaxID=2880260 RepID=A0ABT6KJP8_9MICO|nr:glycosyltransferase family 2 protein [Antiquaquibacter oligotrophicus]MDH6180225.1 hypothetical protein [Antiquaquibacter oligotrophicus]UDF14028.1 glycosyltransferase family 2 protein [Antiquaquibacter oligotrophicus]
MSIPSTDRLPTISVIVAFHNDAEFVPHAVAALRALDYPRLDIVLVDDGSTDGTADLLDDATRDLAGARLLRNDTNRGVAASRNRALADATGEFVWFADSDDRWDPSILRALVAALGERPDAGVAVCSASIVTPDGVSTGAVDPVGSRVVHDREAAVREFLLGHITGYLWTKLVRRDLASEFPLQRSLSDMAFIAGALSASSTVVHTPERLYSYVQRGGSITTGRAVDLDDLALAASDVLAQLADAPSALLTAFRYRFAVVPCHTQWARRREPRRDEVAGLEVRVRVRDIPSILAHDRRTAVKALWIALTGALFPPTYRALTRGRRRG